MMSTSPAAGISEKTAPGRPAAKAPSRRNRPSPPSAATRPPRRGLRRITVRPRQILDPARQHPAALTAHGKDRELDDARCIRCPVAQLPRQVVCNVMVCPRNSAAARRGAIAASRSPVADARHFAPPTPSVMHHIGAVERRAQHGGIRHLATVAAAHAGLVDTCHRIVPQRSSSFFNDKDGQPDRRMQAWSPVHTSSSTPNRGASTRRPSLIAFCCNGFSRRCLFNMHSDDATMTFGPFASVVSASRSTSRIRPTS